MPIDQVQSNPSNPHHSTSPRIPRVSLSATNAATRGLASCSSSLAYRSRGTTLLRHLLGLFDLQTFVNNHFLRKMELCSLPSCPPPSLSHQTLVLQHGRHL